jgi:hypothetical protein
MAKLIRAVVVVRPTDEALVDLLAPLAYLVPKELIRVLVRVVQATSQNRHEAKMEIQ